MLQFLLNCLNFFKIITGINVYSVKCFDAVDLAPWRALTPQTPKVHFNFRRPETRFALFFYENLVAANIRAVFGGLPEPNRACLVGVYAVTLDPLLSLYGIIYVTWYTRLLPKATSVTFW